MTEMLRKTTWLTWDARCRELSGSAAISNFYVRSLGGPDTYKLNLTGVGDEHYAAAKRMLQSFDVVLPLRNLSSLPRLLGMPAGVAMPNVVTDSTRPSPRRRLTHSCSRCLRSATSSTLGCTKTQWACLSGRDAEPRCASGCFGG